jgi:hypothetical protein
MDKPNYRFECRIIDETNGETVIHSSTYLSSIHEDTWGLISCESAEQELFSMLRAFRFRVREKYEAENYQEEEANQ